MRASPLMTQADIGGSQGRSATLTMQSFPWRNPYVLNEQLIALPQKNGVAVFSTDSFRAYGKNTDGKSVDFIAATSEGKRR
jgi:hypothetical protein